MTVTIFRPGQPFAVVGAGVEVMRGRASAAANWWEAGGATGCVAAYQAIGAASLAASYTNLANPGTNNAAPGVAPTWNSTDGWVFDGSQYLDTGLSPAASWSMLVRFANATSNGWQAGVSEGTSKFWGIRSRVSQNDILYYDGATGLQIGVQFAAGVLAIAGATAYRDGAAESGSIPTGGYTAQGTLLIGVLRYNGSPLLSVTMRGNIQALAIYSTTLDAAKVAAVTSAMQALT